MPQASVLNSLIGIVVTRSGSKHFRRVTHCRDYIENGQCLLLLTRLANLFEKKSCDDQARDDYPDRGLAQFAGERCVNSRQLNGRCVAIRNGEVRERLFPSARCAGRANCAADPALGQTESSRGSACAGGTLLPSSVSRANNVPGSSSPGRPTKAPIDIPSTAKSLFHPRAFAVTKRPL